MTKVKILASATEILLMITLFLKGLLAFYIEANFNLPFFP